MKTLSINLIGSNSSSFMKKYYNYDTKPTFIFNEYNHKKLHIKIQRIGQIFNGLLNGKKDYIYMSAPMCTCHRFNPKVDNNECLPIYFNFIIDLDLISKEQISNGYLFDLIKNVTLCIPDHKLCSGGSQNVMCMLPSYIGFTIADGQPLQLFDAFESDIQPSDGWTDTSIKKIKEYSKNNEVSSPNTEIIFKTDSTSGDSNKFGDVLNKVIEACK